MGIQELIQIVYQCKTLLREFPQSSKTFALINRIDQQLKQYSQSKHVNRSFDQVSRSQSRSRSKKKIFQVTSKETSPIKRRNQLKFSTSEILSSSRNQHLLDLSMARSEVSQIALDNVRLNTMSRASEQYENLSHSISMVNNSFDHILSQKEILIQENQVIKQVPKQRQIEIEDFFIIDYNFDKKDYEILPSRQHYKDKCEILSEMQINNNDKSPILSMLRQNSSGTKQAINPFEQIINRQSMNSQLSMDSILSFNRYSMQPQVNSTNSRVLESINHKSQNQIEELYQIREVIMNLVLDSTPANHIQEIKATPSMTDLLKLTTNPSSKNKIIQHIVIPSCLQIRTLQNASNCNKYTHVIKTHEGISYGMRYYECERFYVIVEKNKNFLHVENIIQALIKKAYEIRVKTERQVDNIFYGNIRKYIEQISLIPKNKLHYLVKTKNNQFLTDSTYSNAKMPVSDPLYQVSLYCQAAINFQFTLQLSTNSSSKSFHLVLILMYFVIFQYKIIFLTTRGYENIVSEIINTLIHMFGDLRYIYPIIMAMLTNHHIQFVHAPIPGILALWGKQSRCKKAIEFMKRKLKDQAQEYMVSSSNSSQNNSNSLLTVVVDMNKHQFVGHSFTHKELYVIQNLQNYIRRSNKHNNFFDKMNYFFNEILLNQDPRNSQTEEKWIQFLRQRLRKTQMYEEYMKFQQTLAKQKNPNKN